MVVQRGGLVDGDSKIMKTTIMKTDGVHLTLTHTLELGLAEISGPNYCTKAFSGTSEFTWPRGKYCIARYGGSCPSGFYGGHIHWDDEDSGNINGKQDPIPDGNYDRNTRIYYCCRGDGDVNEPMLLPP